MEREGVVVVVVVVRHRLLRGEHMTVGISAKLKAKLKGKPKAKLRAKAVPLVPAVAPPGVEE